MSLQILGVSGSPIKNSNTDRLVKAVLDESGLESEFVKLSDIDVRPCRACKGCVDDNICKVNDDFPPLAEKVKEAGALVIGGYCPYGAIDGFTKSFLERLWSLRHVNNLIRGKLAVTVITGLVPPIREMVSRHVANQLNMDRMQVVGQLEIQGNLPCLTCGNGDDCEMSGVPTIFGENTPASVDKCVNVEDQDAWIKAKVFGQIIGERLSKNS
jgi:NADPH-dependent FMN reductase